MSLAGVIIVGVGLVLVLVSVVLSVVWHLLDKTDAKPRVRWWLRGLGMIHLYAGFLCLLIGGLVLAVGSSS